ncbi:MAG: WbqC-like family protein [Herbinix sp.]|jgi:hypothetical protein|nr:WbqC-like family protein [Herbinix sp.]
MIVSINQPNYIPYIGYFHRIAKSDVFVLLDNAQFSNNNMHHWNYLKTPQGKLRIKIPVEYNFLDSINQVRTKDELLWKQKHLKIIQTNYGHAKYFKEYFPSFQELLLSQYQNIAEMNLAIIQYISKNFGFSAKLVKASELEIHSFKEERIIDICTALKADTYLSGIGAKAYQEEKHFTDRGIQLCYTDYHSFEYTQLFNGYLSDLSVIDYILNCGFDWDYVEKALK